MSRQLDLYERDHETLMELRNTDEEPMVKCFDCGHIVPKSDTLGGLCGNCVDITKPEEVIS
jgi:uncharacterized Zn finger protein